MPVLNQWRFTTNCVIDSSVKENEHTTDIKPDQEASEPPSFIYSISGDSSDSDILELKSIKETHTTLAIDDEDEEEGGKAKMSEDTDKIVRIPGDTLLIKYTPEEKAYRNKYLPDPSKLTDEKFICTSCSVPLASDVHKGKELYIHRILGVLVCEKCYKFYGDGCFSTDEDGDDKYCRWCGQGGTLYLCSACTCAFCQKCVKQNLKASVIAEVDNDDWKCYVCNPRPLFGTRTICWGAQELNKTAKEKEQDRLKKLKEKQGEKKKEVNERKSRKSLDSEEETSRKRKRSTSDSSPEIMPSKKSKRRSAAESRSLNGKINKKAKQAKSSSDDDSSENDKRVTRHSKSGMKKKKKNVNHSSDEDSDFRSKSKSRLKPKKKNNKESSDESEDEEKVKSKRRSSKKKPDSSDEDQEKKSSKKNRHSRIKKDATDSSSDERQKKKKHQKSKNMSDQDTSDDDKKKTKKKQKKVDSSEEDSETQNKSKTKKRHGKNKNLPEKDLKQKKGKNDSQSEESTNEDKTDKMQSKTAEKNSAENVVVKKRIKLAIMWLNNTVKDISELGTLISVRATKFGKKKVNTDNLKTYDDVLNTVGKLKQLISGVHSNYDHIEKSLDAHLKPWKIFTGLEESENDVVECSITKTNGKDNVQSENTSTLQKSNEKSNEEEKLLPSSTPVKKEICNDTDQKETEINLELNWSGVESDDEQSQTGALILKVSETLDKMEADETLDKLKADKMEADKTLDKLKADKIEADKSLDETETDKTLDEMEADKTLDKMETDETLDKSQNSEGNEGTPKKTQLDEGEILDSKPSEKPIDSEKAASDEDKKKSDLDEKNKTSLKSSSSKQEEDPTGKEVSDKEKMMEDPSKEDAKKLSSDSDTDLSIKKKVRGRSAGKKSFESEHEKGRGDLRKKSELTDLKEHQLSSSDESLTLDSFSKRIREKWQGKEKTEDKEPKTPKTGLKKEVKKPKSSERKYPKDLLEDRDETDDESEIFKDSNLRKSNRSSNTKSFKETPKRKKKPKMPKHQKNNDADKDESNSLVSENESCDEGNPQKIESTTQKGKTNNAQDVKGKKLESKDDKKRKHKHDSDKQNKNKNESKCKTTGSDSDSDKSYNTGKNKKQRVIKTEEKIEDSEDKKAKNTAKDNKRKVERDKTKKDSNKSSESNKKFKENKNRKCDISKKDSKEDLDERDIFDGQDLSKTDSSVKEEENIDGKGKSEDVNKKVSNRADKKEKSDSKMSKTEIKVKEEIDSEADEKSVEYKKKEKQRDSKISKYEEKRKKEKSSDNGKNSEDVKKPGSTMADKNKEKKDDSKISKSEQSRKKKDSTKSPETKKKLKENKKSDAAKKDSKHDKDESDCDMFESQDSSKAETSFKTERISDGEDESEDVNINVSTKADQNKEKIGDSKMSKLEKRTNNEINGDIQISSEDVQNSDSEEITGGDNLKVCNKLVKNKGNSKKCEKNNKEFSSDDEVSDTKTVSIKTDKSKQTTDDSNKKSIDESIVKSNLNDDCGRDEDKNNDSDHSEMSSLKIDVKEVEKTNSNIEITKYDGDDAAAEETTQSGNNNVTAMESCEITLSNKNEEDEEDGNVVSDADAEEYKKYLEIEASTSKSKIPILDSSSEGSEKPTTKNDKNDESTDDENKTKEKKKVLKKRHSQKKSKFSNLLDSSDDSEAAEENKDSEDKDDADSIINLSSEEDSSDADVFQPKKGKKNQKKKSGSSSEEEVDTKKKKKRKLIRCKTSSAESGKSDEEVDITQKSAQGESPGKGGRKNIKKIKAKDDLADATKEAAEEEKERRKRIEERQKLFSQVFQIQETETLTKLVLDFDPKDKEELLSVNPDLVSKMKPHQAKGVKFMWDSCFESLSELKKKKGSGCILAHCMGLGKTFQVISLVHTLLMNDETQIRTVTVVCPLSTVLNWYNEFEKWLKDVEGGDNIDVYHLTRFSKNPDRARELVRWQKSGGVLIIGYEMFRNLTAENKKFRGKMKKDFQETLVDPGADLVVCDEGHMLKNEKTALSKAMARVRTLRRIVLTGTPMQNNLNEYHCMVQFVKPNLLGTRKEFLNRFVNPITNGQFVDSTERDVKVMKRRAHVLHKMLEGLVQRFDYNVLTPFLPPKHEYVISLCLSELQVKLYQHYLENYSQKADNKKAGSRLFVDWQNLGRIWTHPRVIKMSADKQGELREKKALEESDSEGSLKDFIDDGSDSDASSIDEDINSDGSIASNKGRKKAATVTRSTRASRATRATKKSHTGLDSSDDDKAAEEGDGEEPVEELGVEVEKSDLEWWVDMVEPKDLDDINHSAKLVMLFAILKECELVEEKVLVFSQSLFSLNLIEYFLDKIDSATQENRLEESLGNHQGTWTKGLDYFRLDGSTSSDNRNIWCKSFNREDNTRARLFLISTRAGGLGINLTAANRVIIFDASWNPSHDVQSIFRIYRFGQKKPCYVYRFIAHGTMEEKVYDRQVAKQSLSNRVVDEQQVHRHFSANDLNELYTFTPPTPAEDRPTPALPKDILLAELIKQYANWIEKYHEHDSLLENVEAEELNEEERQLAWEDYENDKKRGFMPANTGTGPNDFMRQQIEIIRQNLKTQYPDKSEPELQQMLVYQVSLLMKRQQMLQQQQQQQMMMRQLAQQQQLVAQQQASLQQQAGGVLLSQLLADQSQQINPMMMMSQQQQQQWAWQQQQANMAKLQLKQMTQKVPTNVLQRLQASNQQNRYPQMNIQPPATSSAFNAASVQAAQLQAMKQSYEASRKASATNNTTPKKPAP